MISTLTYPTWHLMEIMSARLITLVFIFCAVLLMGLAIVATAVRNQKIRRRLLLGFTLAFVVLAAAGGGMYVYIKPYLRLSHYVTPRIRVQRPEFAGLVPETGTDIDNLAAYNDYPDLDKLPMYDRHTVKWPVTYKGKASDGTAYFVLNQYKRLYSFGGKVEYTDTKTPYLEGYAYTLNDARYKQLGFINPTKYSTVALVLPKATKKQAYDLQTGTKVFLLQTGGIKWTGETVHRINQW